MVKQKKNTAGRPKKLPTRVVRVQKAKPDFEALASDSESIIGHYTYLGFVSGCHYVWDIYINKAKTTKFPIP